MSSTTSPPTSPTSIEQLPPEMINELFKNLNLKDLVACSLVNKRWHSIYLNFRLHRLVIFWSLESSPSEWYHTGRPIVEKEVCPAKLFNHLVDKPLLSNLNYLVMSRLASESVLDQLNRFEHLLHLEISEYFIEQNANLKLPKLRILAIYNLHGASLTIDCDELHVLAYREHSGRLQVKHPETIQKLATSVTGPKLAAFKNVACLQTDTFEAITRETLQMLPRLKELNYNRSISSHFTFRSQNGSFDQMKQKLREFLHHIQTLRASDFRFCFAGFQLSSGILDQIDFGVQLDDQGKELLEDEYVYLKNYHLIDASTTLNFIHMVDYNRLIRVCSSMDGGSIPVGFFKKFTGSIVVAYGTVADADHFHWFLKSVPSVRTLDLEKTGLAQEFYDKLPASAPCLTQIEIRGDGELQMSFDFINELNHLNSLMILQNVCLESLHSLIRWLGKLTGCVTIAFKVKETSYRIKKYAHPNPYEIFYLRRKLFETKHPDEIWNFVEELQKKASRF